MDDRAVRVLLEDVSAGRMDAEQALVRLRAASVSGPGFADLGFAKVDTQRAVRQGATEVIYGAGKTAGQIASICNTLIEAGQSRVLVTRLNADKAREVAAAFSSDVPFEFREQPGLGIVGGLPEPESGSCVLVACAGTSDLPVAEEAAVTAEVHGCRVTRLYDAGVAGIHRLLAHADDIAQAHVIVAVAGMEGALPSVIGGLAACPVIAVPTSVGYGASFGGVTALLAMLNSCASGVSVVNIDNGFGAGYQAALIDRAWWDAREPGRTSSESGCDAGHDASFEPGRNAR